MFDLARAQAAIREQNLSGWLLYDFRGTNVLAARIAGTTEGHRSRRWFYYVPAEGSPVKLVHKIESAGLDHLPGDEKLIYLTWQELEAGVEKLVQGADRVAMEYVPRAGNPYVSRVDAGTVELVRSFGPEVVSSGDLVQEFEATWDDEQWQLHLAASAITDAAFGMTWAFIADQITKHGYTTETAVQKRIMDYFAEHNLVTDHAPIIGVWEHAGDPHFAPRPEIDKNVEPGSLILVDMWGKLNSPKGVYSDQTKMGFVGETVPEHVNKAFHVIVAARDAAIARVERAFAAGDPIQGWQVDFACRDVIEQAGYGQYFIHRTGHNIGRETHGNGANMDGLETREERRVMRRTCFSVEPGIYTPEFGVRTEVDVFVDADGKVHVTGADRQAEIRRILV